jgi:hypothetical protein
MLGIFISFLPDETFTCGSLLKYILKFFSTNLVSIHLHFTFYVFESNKLGIGLKVIHKNAPLNIYNYMYTNVSKYGFFVNAERVREVAKHTQKR